MKVKKKKLGRITLALILAACCMSAIAGEKVDVETSANSGDAATGIATGVAKSYHQPDSPSKPLEGAKEASPIPVVSFEDNVPETATTEASEEVGISGESTGDKLDTPWYTKLWNMLAADEDSVKAHAQLMVKKMQVDRQYGAGSSEDPNFTVILEAQAELGRATERREQAELALRIRQDEQQMLYDDSLLCLALNGYHEARGETADQEVATAAVVLNRLSVNFRKATTICEVIYTPKQFSWVEEHGVHVPDTSNKVEKQAWERSLLIARRMLDPDATFIDPSNGALYYYNPSIVDWKYKNSYTQVAVLGSHRFMTEKILKHPHHIDNRQVRINPVLFNGLTSEERKSLVAEYQSDKVGN